MSDHDVNEKIGECAKKIDFGPKTAILGPKLATLGNRGRETPFCGTGAFVPLGVGPVSATSDLLCNFLFPSYASFREGTRPMRQKVLPQPNACGDTVYQ